MGNGLNDRSPVPTPEALLYLHRLVSSLGIPCIERPSRSSALPKYGFAHMKIRSQQAFAGD